MRRPCGHERPAYKVVAGYDFIGKDGDPMPDIFAHGTATAGVAAGNSYVFNGQRFQGIARHICRDPFRLREVHLR